MKIAVSGKGGAGKTSIACGLAISYSEKLDVLAVDADASLNLATTLGVENPKPLSQIKEIAKERARLSNGLVRMNPQVEGLIDEYSKKVSETLRLLVMGTVTGAGSGCLCPENAILRSLLSKLVLKRNEVVVIDLEAGFEPMTRGTIRNIDAILVVCEPSKNSVSVSQRILKLAKELGVEKAHVIANKIEGEKDLEFIEESLPVFHSLPTDPDFALKSRISPYPKNTEFHRKIRELAGKLS